MRTTPLLPLLRSQTQGAMLAELYLHPDREFSLTELARLTDSNVKSIHFEADRLGDAGFVKSRKLGNVRLLSADTSHRLAGPLSELLIASYGPLPVVREAFGELSDVRDIYIYGSWAERANKVPGKVPQDVDVLVVGTPDADAVFDAAHRASQILGFDVNARTVRPQRWDSPGDDYFIAQMKSGSLVAVNTTDEGPKAR